MMPIQPFEKVNEELDSDIRIITASRQCLLVGLENGKQQKQ